MSAEEHASRTKLLSVFLPIWIVTAVSSAAMVNLWRLDSAYPDDAQSPFQPWAVSFLVSSAACVWLRIRPARMAYLLGLAFFVVSGVHAGIAAIPFLVSSANESHVAWTDMWLWWHLTAVPRWIIWFALNVWLLFNFRAQQYFRRNRN